MKTTLRTICLLAAVFLLTNAQKIQNSTNLDNFTDSSITNTESDNSTLVPNNTSTENEPQTNTTQVNPKQNEKTQQKSNITQNIPNAPITKNQSIIKNQIPSIYGVRWSLGDYFSYQNAQSSDSSSHFYTLSFNSPHILPFSPSLSLKHTVYTCSHLLLKVPLEQTHDPEVQLPENYNQTGTITQSHIYRCNVNNDIRGQEIEYVIYMESQKYRWREGMKSGQSDRQIITENLTLFTGVFRATKQNQQNILVVGDWGIIPTEIQISKKYIPILQGLSQQLQKDHTITALIFLGDLAYDFILSKYQQMLQYMQPITSKICFMPTPGNHDYVYHSDSFQLFMQTFYSPQWSKYHGFYYNFILGDFLFVNSVPLDLAGGSKIQLRDSPLEYLKKQFYQTSSAFSSVSKVKPIAQEYHVVIFSHYPIFCSKQNDDLSTCQVSKQKLADYIDVFNDIGYDMYLSGHLHYYQRSFPLCYSTKQKTIKSQKQTFQKDGVKGFSSSCPIFIVDGVGGNSYFEQSEGSIKAKEFADKISQHTGFGVLTLQTKDDNDSKDSLLYTHYIMLDQTTTKVQDKFIKSLPVLSSSSSSSNTNSNSTDSDSSSSIFSSSDNNNKIRMTQIIIIVLFVVGMTGLCYCFGNKWANRQAVARPPSGHVDMVQQNAGEIIEEHAHSAKSTHDNPGRFDIQ